MFKLGVVGLICLTLGLFTIKHHPIAEASNSQKNMVGLPDTIFWRPDIKLHWVDFRSKPDKASSFVAYSSTFITLKYSIKFKGGKVIPDFNVSCGFNCKKSWARKDKPDLLTQELLEHEQLHFDIAELTARKLIKTLKNQSYTKANYEYKIEGIRNNIINEGDDLQNRYDKETGHGTNSKEQLAWKNRIELELKKTGLWR